MRLIAALCLVLSSAALAAKPAHAPVQAAPACDRECLRGKVSEVLYALVDHDVKKLPVAANLPSPRTASRSRSTRSAWCAR
jgi:hypothetical protein